VFPLCASAAEIARLSCFPFFALPVLAELHKAKAKAKKKKKKESSKGMVLIFPLSLA
jgi:hypothetical protein